MVRPLRAQWLLYLLLAGCPANDPPADAGRNGLADAVLGDDGATDVDAMAAEDTGPFDAGPFDAGPFDAAPGDEAGPIDAGSFDAGAGVDAPRVSMPCTAAGACDPFDPEACGAGMACRPGAMGAPTACAMLSGTVVPEGGACAAGSQCAGGSACLDFGDGPRCHRLCPMGSIGACGTSAVCTGTITGGDACIMVCRALPLRCDIYEQDCADPGQACTLVSNPETDERYTGCRTAGTRTDGQPCGGSFGTCARGLICVNDGSGGASCRHVCVAAATPTTCPMGQACTGTTRGWGVTYCRAAM